MAESSITNASETAKSSEPQVFGRLTVIGQPFQREYGNQGATKACVECRCSCGTVGTYRLGDLKSGHTRSCGCLSRKRVTERKTTHGHSKRGQRSPTYHSWAPMVKRCTNPNYPGFADYGGRGITVCDRWLGENGFPNFLADMGEKPEGTSIDRVDNDRGYCPENCRWATAKEQGNNRRSNRLITAFGRTQTMAQWAEELGISRYALRNRVDRCGWPVERALTTPARRKCK